MRLYDLARVEQAESSKEYQAFHAGSAARRRSAQQAAQQCRAATLAAVEAVPIRLPDLEQAELERRAVAHRNHLAAERAVRAWNRSDGDYEYDPATVEDASEAALARWSVNWLRHQATPYDRALADLDARVGRHEAARLLRRRVYAEIAAAFPWLGDECARQLAERGELGIAGGAA